MRTRENLFLWSAILALCSAIPFLMIATGHFPHLLNEGLGGLVASSGLAIMTAGCGLILLAMLVALFRARGSFAARVGWLILIFASGWFGAAIYYFVVFRPELKRLKAASER